MSGSHRMSKSERPSQMPAKSSAPKPALKKHSQPTVSVFFQSNRNQGAERSSRGEVQLQSGPSKGKERAREEDAADGGPIDAERAEVAQWSKARPHKTVNVGFDFPAVRSPSHFTRGLRGTTCRRSFTPCPNHLRLSDHCPVPDRFNCVKWCPPCSNPRHSSLHSSESNPRSLSCAG